MHGGVKGEREAVFAMEAKGQFADILLSIRVPRWRWGLVSKPQELRQIPPTAFRERRAGGGGRGHGKGARRHGELQPAVGEG